MSIYVFDLDGTIANCDHRVDFAKAKDWDGFQSRLHEDTPYPEMVDLAITLSAGIHCILIVTGRMERNRGATERWLSNATVPYDHLLMRPDDDYSKDYICKLRLIDDFFGKRENALRSVSLCFDDRDTVVEGFRNAGFICAQVRNGSF